MCLGHIIDADGRKMSKSLGNIIDPWTILDTRGADALRWWMFSQGSPWTPTRASLAAIDTAMRDMLLKLWNTFSFFTTYASLNGFDPADPDVPPPASRGALDRWVLSRLASTSLTVTTALEAYEPLDAASALAGLVDDLSNWYVRRCRRRFWRTDPDAPAGDTLAAQATLHDVLTHLSLLLAPFCPFVADAMWRAAQRCRRQRSRCTWPIGRRPTRTAIDRDLEAQMDLARRLTSLGRAARSEAGVKVRQPLSRALVFLPPGAPAILHDMVAEELNVDEIDVADELSEVLQFELSANFRTLGPRLREQVQAPQAGTGRARRRGGGGRRSRRVAPSPSTCRVARSSSVPTTCSFGSAASRASPSPGKGARWWRSTSRWTTRCATVAWPGRSSVWCRTCARTAAWTSPIASTSASRGWT